MKILLKLTEDCSKRLRIGKNLNICRERLYSLEARSFALATLRERLINTFPLFLVLLEERFALSAAERAIFARVSAFLTERTYCNLAGTFRPLRLKVKTAKRA